MDLEPETLRRLQEYFANQTCCKCGQPAVRFARDRFYCEHDYPYGTSTPIEGRKVYKHPNWSKGNG